MLYFSYFLSDARFANDFVVFLDKMCWSSVVIRNIIIIVTTEPRKKHLDDDENACVI